MARMGRRTSSFISGFLEGYDAVGKVAKDYELGKVASGKPEELLGYTEDQGEQLRLAAESGQYDVGVKTNDDGTFAGYVVTPKADPSQSAIVGMQGVTDFLGQRTAGKLSDEQIDRARKMAMAGVYEKYGDVEAGMRLRDAVKQGERDDQRWLRQQKQWEREDKDRADQEAYEQGRRELFGQTRFAQNQANYQRAMQEYQQRLQEWEQNPQGMRPVEPTRPEYSIGDSLFDRAMLVQYEAEHNKLDPRTFGEFVDMMQRVQGEGYERALRMAHSGAPVDEVIKAFNSTGKIQADPSRIVSDKTVAGPDGVPTRVIQFRDANGNIRTIDTLAELDALGKAGEVFNRFYKAREDARAERADERAGRADQRAAAAAARAAAEDARKRRDAEAKAAAAVALYKERNPNATEAEIAAVRHGVLDAVPRADDKAPAEVRLARALVDAKIYPDMASALKHAMSSKGKSPQERIADIYAQVLNSSMGNHEVAARVAEQARQYLFPTESAPANQSGNGAPAKPSPSGSREASGRFVGNAPYPEGTRLRGKDGKMYVVRNGVPVPE